MVSKVLYRPFEEADFDALAEIVQKQWHAGTDNEAYNRLEASDDLAYCLSSATFSQVALIDGAPRGIVLARAGAKDATWEQSWLDRSAAYLGQMAKMLPEAQRRYRAFIAASTRVNDELVDAADIDTGSEIVLLAVADSARGMGIGSVLLDAAAAYVASLGYPRTFLFTDSSCTWQFYERLGLKRAAQHHATREERRLLPRDMYLYSMDLTA